MDGPALNGFQAISKIHLVGIDLSSYGVYYRNIYQQAGLRQGQNPQLIWPE